MTPSSTSSTPLKEQHAADHPPRRRALLAASGAHAVHDGMTDALYVLLPIWQSEFAISYALAGLLRGLYAGFMAGFQIQAGALAERFGRKRLLVGGTALAGIAYLIAGQTGALLGLGVALAAGGLGASTQHPLASALVADAYEQDRQGSRSALATYNFAGDMGKMAIPAALGVALTYWSWRQGVVAIACIGLAAALWLAWMIPGAPWRAGVAAENNPAAPASPASMGRAAGYGLGFRALLATGVIDSAVRMAFLTFLPFMLKAKGATSATLGLALSLIFVGGAVGKLACACLGKRIGMMKTVWLTEALTALLIVAVPGLPIWLSMAILPLLGVVLNGTSSVLYGNVPELVPAAARTRAFALFYTGTIGGSALAPIAFGWLGDQLGLALAMQCAAALACLTMPLIWLVDRELRIPG